VETYEVKAGEYIQIIDTSGRQCSDFLAFDKAKLDKKIESIIDATALVHLWGQLIQRLVYFQNFLTWSMTL
jgi:uncharacterized protein YcgI (DUF1989 family)